MTAFTFDLSTYGMSRELQLLYGYFTEEHLLSPLVEWKLPLLVVNSILDIAPLAYK